MSSKHCFGENHKNYSYFNKQCLLLGFFGGVFFLLHIGSLSFWLICFEVTFIVPQIKAFSPTEVWILLLILKTSSKIVCNLIYFNSKFLCFHIQWSISLYTLMKGCERCSVIHCLTFYFYNVDQIGQHLKNVSNGG